MLTGHRLHVTPLYFYLYRKSHLVKLGIELSSHVGNFLGHN
jgi:hypothetical protein